MHPSDLENIRYYYAKDGNCYECQGMMIIIENKVILLSIQNLIVNSSNLVIPRSYTISNGIVTDGYVVLSEIDEEFNEKTNKYGTYIDKDTIVHY